MTEVNIATAGWHRAPLGELLEIRDSERIPVNAGERARRPGDIPYFGATGQVGWIDGYLFDEELILLGEDGAPFLQGDKPKAYVIRGKSWVNNHAHVLRALASSPSAFWKHQLDQVDFHEFVSGTTRLKLPQGPMRQIPLLVPPLPEQQRIVAAIESYFTRLDDAVATLERVQRNLKRYRASVLKAAVEGRLVPTEAELARAEGRSYEPASVLLERILAERRRRWEEGELAKMRARGKAPKDDKWKAKYVEPVTPDTSELPELPEGWCWANLSAVTTWGPQNGLYVPKSDYGRGTPILRIDDYQVDVSRSSGDLQRIEISADDAKKYGLRAGDVVINRVNSPSHLGKSLAVVDRHLPAVFESNMMRLGLSAAVLPAYVHNYLSSVDGKARLISNAKWAVNQASINQEDVGATPLPLPPEEEQKRIVTEIDRLLSSGQDASAITLTSEVRCARLRQSILKWAFEGRLVDQDPTDEPASALLKRIRAERETGRARVDAPASSLEQALPSVRRSSHAVQSSHGTPPAPGGRQGGSRDGALGKPHRRRTRGRV